jgi:hypothetical protein
MARLIDADALMCDIGETVLFSGKPDMVSAESRGARKVVDRIEAAPTVDTVEVKHGRWISHEGYEECDRCHAKAIYPHNFCPNCGARMDGDTE